MNPPITTKFICIRANLWVASGEDERDWSFTLQILQIFSHCITVSWFHMWCFVQTCSCVCILRTDTTNFPGQISMLSVPPRTPPEPNAYSRWELEMCGKNQQIIRHQNAIWCTHNPTFHLQERLRPPETLMVKRCSCTDTNSFSLVTWPCRRNETWFFVVALK